MTINFRKTAYLALAVLFMLGSTASIYAGDTHEASAGIGKTNSQFMDAINSGDAAGVTALYTDDGQILPPNGATQSGHEAIQPAWQGLIDAGLKVQLITGEIEVFGDSATEVGKYVLTSADGQTVDDGKFIVIWKKVEGDWKLHRDIWNSSVPLPGPEDEGSEDTSAN